MDATSRPTPTPTSAAADGGQSKRMPLVERRRTSPALAAYVAATIVAGVAALAWATLTLPLGPDIATDGLTHIAADDRVSGLLFWIAFGLLGSARTKGYGGHAVLTFHLPFIVAAMALGGPVAGGSHTTPAWVANLEAHPDIEFEFGDQTYSGRAVVYREGAERDRLWDAHVEQLPHFAAYPEQTGRVIPMARIVTTDR